MDAGFKDVAAAKKFYRAVFGWTAKDNKMGDGFTYSLMRLRGKDVAGIYPRMEPQAKTKSPAFWLPYIAVKNVAATVRKAKAARAKVVTPAMKVAKLGRMAVLADPAGASFGLWQPGQMKGSQIADVAGSVCWHDLNTAKPKVAKRFYEMVFGWTASGQDVGGNPYTVFTLGRKPVAGVWPEPMKKLGPCWVTHWEVRDCAKTVANVKRLRGRVLMGTTKIPSGHRFAVLADPWGAVFGVIEFAGD